MWSLSVQKILPDSLEVFLKNPLKFFHFSFFFSKSRGILSNVLAAKNGFWGRMKSPKIAPESKNAIFSKSEIMLPRSNLGKRKVKLMLVRPQKGFTTTTAVSEKISNFDFLVSSLPLSWAFVQKCHFRAKKIQNLRFYQKPR